MPPYWEEPAIHYYIKDENGEEHEIGFASVDMTFIMEMPELRQLTWWQRVRIKIKEFMERRFTWHK